MRTALLAAVCILFFNYLSGQVIYVSSSANAIYRLNLDDCSYSFVTQVNRQIYDIAFHPDGSLYGISGNGNFFSIDTLTGNTSLIYNFIGQSFNSLTISADSLVYTIGDEGELWTYDLISGAAIYLGYIGFDASGDLSFYKGILYVAVTNDRIVSINLNEVQNSTIVINDNIPGNILGIVSGVVDCSEINCYAITNGLSDIYKINFATSMLELVCELNISVGGGASTSEFLGSSPLQLDSIELISPNCYNKNGQAIILATGGSGALSYSINTGNLQDSNHFSELTAGQYTVIVADQLGCEDSISFSFAPVLPLVIDSIILQPSICGEDNGLISTFASGGSGPLSYSLDSIYFQSSGLFANLGPARYQLCVVDSTGCFAKDEVLIDSLIAASIIQTDIINTSCGEANGEVTIFTNPSDSIRYSIDGLYFQMNNVFENLLAKPYLLLIEDNNGCHDTLSINIAPSDFPVIDVVNSTPEYCGKQNGSLTINGSGGSEAYQYSMDGSSFQPSNTFSNLSSGTYPVFILDNAGCSNMGMTSITAIEGLTIVGILSQPSDCGESTGQLHLSIEGGSAPVMFSLNNNTSQAEELFTELAAGTYEVLAMDAAGCAADTLVKIAKYGCPVYIPTIFSPNGDGINDLFQIQTINENNIMISRFFIFDRWGNEVYERLNFPIKTNEGWWDGTYKHFTMNPGVFAYYLEVELENGQRETYKGNVTLIR